MLRESRSTWKSMILVVFFDFFLPKPKISGSPISRLRVVLRVFELGEHESGNGKSLQEWVKVSTSIFLNCIIKISGKVHLHTFNCSLERFFVSIIVITEALAENYQRKTTKIVILSIFQTSSTLFELIVLYYLRNWMRFFRNK